LDRLRGVQRGAVAGTFDEVDPRNQRIPRQRRQIERERLPHQTMNQQSMLLRQDVRDAAVIPLEVQRVGRNRPFQELERRA
jgi:hypothetical protein